MAQIHVQFEDGSSALMTPTEIGRLCYDLGSWWNIMRMISGQSDKANLSITSTNNYNRSLEQSEAIAYLNKPPN